jgi:hypothetical protein
MISVKARIDKWLLVIILFLAGTGWHGHSTAQEETARYFPQTGQWVAGEFLQFYNRLPNPETVLGNPISEEFTSTKDPNNPELRVQYFENARLELRPENPLELRVVLTPLGEYLYPQTAPDLVFPNPLGVGSPACLTFQETDAIVCHAFKDFFEANGGIAVFGYPISEIEIRDGLMVQYFQKTRLEYRSQLPSGQRVQVSNFSEIYYLVLQEDPLHKLPSPIDFAALVLQLQAHGFVSQASISASGTQTLYVIVQDQNFRPMQGAQVTVIARTGNRELGRYLLPVTNAFGFSQLSFPVPDGVVGIVELIITAAYDTLQDTTITCYRIW